MSEQQNSRSGFAFGIGVYFLWGLVPLYFKLLDHVGAVEIVAHRIIWAVGFLALLLLLTSRLASLRSTLRNRRMVVLLGLSSLLIAINWLTYIYAVVESQVLAASLGYFLNPFVNIALGTLFLRETLRPLTIAAVALAALGVAVLATAAFDTLWISLTLAFSFGLYGFVRKVSQAGAIEGLAVETAILTPPSLAYLFWLGAAGGLAFGTDLETDSLLIVSALVTSVPLMLFAAAARRLTLTTLGFVQYLAPSMVFLIGVFIFNEPLNTGQIICFLCIWGAVALFIIDSVRATRSA
jgi:chloramphenicol-sensitive protein RarD